MASWTSIPNSSLETGAPARSVDALAFRDNPIAIAEGAVGAPRITGSQGQVVQNAAIYDNAITSSKMANPSVGTTYTTTALYSSFSTLLNTFQTVNAKGASVLPGTLSITAELAAQTNSAILRVYKNGAFIFDLSTSSTSYVTVIGNVSTTPGDVFTFQLRSTNLNNDRSAYLQNLRITTGNDSMCAVRIT